MGAALDPFEELIQQLRVEGHVEAAAKLHRLLHEVAWTSSSELMGELGLSVLAFDRTAPRIGTELRHLVDRCMRSVRQVWPDIK
jgi:hypothetical protein